MYWPRLPTLSWDNRLICKRSCELIRSSKSHRWPETDSLFDCQTRLWQCPKMESRSRWLCAPRGWTAQCYGVLPLRYSRALVDFPIESFPQHCYVQKHPRSNKPPSRSMPKTFYMYGKPLSTLPTTSRRTRSTSPTHPSLRKQPCAPSIIHLIPGRGTRSSTRLTAQRVRISNPDTIWVLMTLGYFSVSWIAPWAPRLWPFRLLQSFGWACVLYRLLYPHRESCFCGIFMAG